MIVRGAMAGTVDLTVDPIILTDNATGRTASAPAGGEIIGDRPPGPARSWWPWILLGGAALVLYWIAQEDKEEAGTTAGPFGP